MGVAQDFGHLLRVSRDITCIRAEPNVRAFVWLQKMGDTTFEATVMDQGSVDSVQTQFLMCCPGFYRLSPKLFIFASNVEDPAGESCLSTAFRCLKALAILGADADPML